MNLIVKDEQLELKYEPGKGAWTYHVQIPNTKHIVAKWGSLKAAGTIDDYPLEKINLFTISGQDKLISINEKIRKAINKTGGEKVKITLYLLTSNQQFTEDEILETFSHSGVLEVFESLSEDEKKRIIEEIKTQKSEEKQVKTLSKFINQFNLSNEN